MQHYTPKMDKRRLKTSLNGHGNLTLIMELSWKVVEFYFLFLWAEAPQARNINAESVNAKVFRY